MTHENGFSPAAQRYLDGDGALATAEGREEIMRFAAMLESYRDSLPVPGSEVDTRVMAAVAPRPSVVRQRLGWRWFVEPQAFRMRPVLAAAALALVAAGVSWVALRETATPDSVLTVAAPQVLVRFELRAPEANLVALAGSFNDWNSDASLLTLNRATGLWTITVPLAPGEHQYMFVIDGEEWVPDPTAHAQVDDGFGETNSVITVTSRGVVRT